MLPQERQFYLIRHGETEWARDGRHTGRTDIPLTQTGREQAGFLQPIFEDVAFEAILSSPLQRAQETAKLAEPGHRVELVDDLHEWDYGDYEGITTAQIRQKVPDWTIWSHGCPSGECAADVGKRADRIVARLNQSTGHVAVFSHGHFLRVLVARWIDQPPECGRHFLLGTSTLSILGFEHQYPAIKTWNGPLITAACAVPWRHASVPG